MSKYSAFIIEDEIHNVNLLKSLLEEFCQDVEVIGIGKTVGESKKIIENQRPDIIFLDVKLKNEISLEIFEDMSENKSQIIFTSAFNEYAIEAFRINAVDFLAKPIDINRLRTAVDKAIQNLKLKHLLDGNKEKREEVKNLILPIPNHQDFIAIPSKSEVLVIKFQQILYLSSVRKYTIFHLKDNDQIVATSNIGHFEVLLQSKNFYRIHNSYIINVDHLVRINKANGNYCELINNVSLPIARRRFSGLKKHITRK